MKICRRFMPFAEVLKHADRFNKNYPDMTVSWEKFTSWWEIKFYNEEPFKSPEGQEIKCQRLARQGVCYYIIYEERRAQRRTLIVHPDEIGAWTTAVNATPGFDHIWVSHFIRQTHQLYHTIHTHADHR
jgi:hypothetical protein